MFYSFFYFYFQKIKYNLNLFKFYVIFLKNNVNEVVFLLDKLKILIQIKIIKYYLIFVEINIIKWYNTEKVNMLNKEVIIVNENLDKKILGENIKKRRIELGLSQKKLASNLGISNVSLSQYETGDVNIPLATLNELANLLQTSVGKLLGTKEEIEYTTDRQTLLNKAIKNTNTLAIAVEKGIDKVENIFAPILKNSLDDIVILDIDGRTYEETVNHRKDIRVKINFSRTPIKYEDKGFQKEIFGFNPFELFDLKNSKEEIKNIVFHFLNIYEENEKTLFLTSIIADFYFSFRYSNDEETNFKTPNILTFEILYDFLNNYLKNCDNLVDFFKEMNKNVYIIEDNYNRDRFLLEELGIIDSKNPKDKELIEKGFIPEYYYNNLKLINLGNEKLKKIRDVILEKFKIFDSDYYKNPNIIRNISIEFINVEFDTLTNDSLLSMSKFQKDLGFITDRNDSDNLKTYYFIVEKQDLEILKPIIRLFFYFLFEKVSKNYHLYEKFSKENKNLIVILDDYSILDLNLKDEKYKGVKKVLVSNLSEIKEDYFKIENENMKVTEKKMEYLYKIEENGNIDFYKDNCPVSKPKKVSIEDELRTFKEL